MSEQELRGMFAIVSQWARWKFEKCGQIHPMWHAVTASGVEFVTPRLHDHRDLCVAMIRALFRARDVVRYIYVDEAWMVIRPRCETPDEQARLDREGISNDPARTEIVLMSGEDIVCGQLMAHRLIIRPDHGKPHLGPLQWTGDGLPNPRGVPSQYEGRMIGLLPMQGSVQ